MEAVNRDPLTTAGWRSLSMLAIVVLILTAGLGYAIYMVAFGGHARSETGFLRALGLSRGQMLGLIGFEHISIAAIGLGLGTWTGFQMSRIMVSAVAIDEAGDDVVPPFILTTDWPQMLVTYAVLLAIFAATVALMNRSIRRRDLHAIAAHRGRLEGPRGLRRPRPRISLLYCRSRSSLPHEPERLPRYLRSRSRKRSRSSSRTRES